MTAFDPDPESGRREGDLGRSLLVSSGRAALDVCMYRYDVRCPATHPLPKVSLVTPRVPSCTDR